MQVGNVGTLGKKCGEGGDVIVLLASRMKPLPRTGELQHYIYEREWVFIGRERGGDLVGGEDRLGEIGDVGEYRLVDGRS